MQLHRRLLLCAVALILHPASALSVDYFVDASNCSNGNTGLEGSPLCKIQAAVNLAGPGDTVYVLDGDYREEILIKNKAGTADRQFRLYAYTGHRPVVYGSNLVSGWTPHQGTIWKVGNWTVNSQQVFVDDVPLQQIGNVGFSGPAGYFVPKGTAVNDMTEGSFFYDSPTQTLYVWLADGSDPNSHKVEVSARNRGLFVDATAPYVHIKGLRFRHGNVSSVTQGGMVHIGPYGTIEACDIQWGDFAGVSLGGNIGGRLLDSIVSNNGAQGVAGATAREYLVSGNTITHNNYRQFDPLWAAAGIKFIPNTWGTIEHNEIAHNSGHGVWSDGNETGNTLTIRNNYIHHNGGVRPAQQTVAGSGIFFEVSNNGLIYNNVVAGNSVRGIYIAASSDTLVAHNLVTGTTGSRAGIEVFGVDLNSSDTRRHYLKNIRVLNNILYDNPSTWDLFMTLNDGTYASGNSSDHNLIYSAGRSPQLRSFDLLANTGVPYASVAEWQAETGWDGQSVFESPQFEIAAGDAYIPGSTSPVLNAGVALPEVATDYWDVIRAYDGQSDLGPYEMESTDVDADGVANAQDNCPAEANADQADLDGDGTGDACDADGDADGYAEPADCNDLDAESYPGALETPFDGLDQNCDGVDATIRVDLARANLKAKTLRVEAVSAAGMSDRLSVEGYPAMTWKKGVWHLQTAYTGLPPDTLIITGAEGSIAVGVEFK